VHFDFSAVPRTGTSLNESARLAARRERNDAVRLRLQAFSKFADMGECASWEAFDVEEQQVLKWCYAARSEPHAPRIARICALVAETPISCSKAVLERGAPPDRAHLFTSYSKASKSGQNYQQRDILSVSATVTWIERSESNVGIETEETDLAL